MNKLLTVIMPSLNVGPYIEECIKSAIAQTLKGIEILCIDAGSTDGTLEILNNYAQQDDRIHIIHSDKKSYGYQVNTGIRMAKGKYIAILETDDYVVPEMYEALYQKAEESDLDYIQADFHSFFDDSRGRRHFQFFLAFFESEEKLYEQVICPAGNPIVFYRDYNVWRGIYKKEFLVKNDLFFNESPGAAFQDIGFSELTASAAQRMMLVPESYYRYRFDREASSIHSPNTLMLSYNEFHRLLDDDVYLKRLTNLQGTYVHLSYSFWGEVQNVIRACDYDASNERITTYIPWFKEKIIKGIEKYHTDVLLDPDFIQKLRTFFADPSAYALQMKEKDMAEEEFFNSLKSYEAKNGFVIFGAGRRGQGLLSKCLAKNIFPLAICDNDVDKWGKEIEGIRVISPEEAMKRYIGASFVIANKASEEEIKKQLLQYRITEILFYHI